MRYSDFIWFADTIRKAVKESAAIACVMRAVLEGRRPRIRKILSDNPAAGEAISEAVENANIMRETPYGRRALRQLINEHRYKAGFRTDDIALRYAYKAWISGKEDVSLPRQPPRRRQQKA